jgi:hypothetical protein
MPTFHRGVEAIEDDRAIGLQGLDQAALARPMVANEDREGREFHGPASAQRLEVSIATDLRKKRSVI